MPTNDNNEQGTTGLLPKFNFEVDLGIGLHKIPFHEITGLEVEPQIIEYRTGNRPQFNTIKMPGLSNYGNIILKQGIFVNDATFRDWYQKISLNTIERTTVIIKLLDQNGSIRMQWSLLNACPTKITTTNLILENTEVGIETIEIAHDQRIISNVS
ncbi:phage tail protein [Flavobacterium sp. XS2P14]|uniref:phage tail protein n=1 Tax=Flavobacterium sp. XS2P14 TaxID=3401735 RepID=UPI003AAAF87B